MKIALICAGGTLVTLVFLGWMMTRLEYRVGSKHLKVILFGFVIRKIPLAEIDYVSKRRPSGMAEWWVCTLKTSHRLVTIERTRGIRKYFCISPKNRYVFLAELKNAVRRIKPEAEWTQMKNFETLQHCDGEL